MLARTSHADVTTQTTAGSFYTVQWGSFEMGPIDGAAVLKRLEEDIENHEAKLAGARKGLEEALG